MLCQNMAGLNLSIKPQNHLHKIHFQMMCCLLSYKKTFSASLSQIRMVLLNISVFCQETQKVLLPWNVLGIQNPDESFHSLYNSRIKERLEETVVLKSCYVGHSKNSLDSTSLDLLVFEIASAFGQYVKYVVTKSTTRTESLPGVSSSLSDNSTNGSVRNAFCVLMASAAELKVPERKAARTKKDDLYNGIVDLLEELNMLFPASLVKTSGSRLVTAVCYALWYIDGTHDTLAARSFNIPSVFSHFQGYNKPELSKHRKRDRANLCETELRKFSSNLFTELLGTYWSRSSGWILFRDQVEALAKSMGDYADYLSEKNKSVKKQHAQLSSSRQLEENLSITFVSVADVRPSKVEQLNRFMSQSKEFELV